METNKWSIGKLLFTLHNNEVISGKVEGIYKMSGKISYSINSSSITISRKEVDLYESKEELLKSL